MADTIPDSFKNEYHNEFEVQFQQNGSRLAQTCAVITQNVEVDFRDRLSKLSDDINSVVSVRHGQTVYSNPENTRVAHRIVTHRPPAHLFDSVDQLRMRLADPRAGYQKNHAMFLGRKKDSAIITAAVGTTYTGKDGTVAETYDASTYGVAVDAVPPGATPTNSNLTIEKLIQARSLLGRQESIMDGEPLWLILSQRQEDALLRLTETVNQDYNTTRVLVEGKIKSFMGFNFIRTELLSKSGNVRTCLAYPQGAITLSEGSALKTRMDEMPNLNYSWQVWSEATFGATREWREKVVSIACDEAIA